MLTRLNAMESECKDLREKFRKVLDEKNRLARELEEQKAKLINSEKAKDVMMHEKDETIKNLEIKMKENESMF